MAAMETPINDHTTLQTNLLYFIMINLASCSFNGSLPILLKIYLSTINVTIVENSDNIIPTTGLRDISLYVATMIPALIITSA